MAVFDDNPMLTKDPKPSFGKNCPCGKSIACLCHSDGGHIVCCAECKDYCNEIKGCFCKGVNPKNWVHTFYTCYRYPQDEDTNEIVL